VLPVITIIGRPNVGKSTLFNRLTKSRDALVADQPGVTRDRQYGLGKVGDRPYLVVDTGGIREPDDSAMAVMTESQVKQAINEADVILFLVDARAGVSSADEAIAKQLRACANKVFVVVNKVDHHDPDVVVSEFYSLGFKVVMPITANRGQGVKTLMYEVLKPFPEEKEETDYLSGIKIAIVGRPNVGKSTLINRLLGEERVVVLDQPGTTRDSIYIPFERRDKKYILIDTAGVRRQAKISEVIEKLSLVKTFQAMQDAHVVVMVLNAREGILDQDQRLLGMVLEMGKALVLAINKWDELDESDRLDVKNEIDRRLMFVDFARRYFISALHGSGVGLLYRAIDEAYASASRHINTGQLTKVLEQAVKDHQPPLVRGRRVKLRLAHMGGHHPMIVIIHGKQTAELPLSYKRYLSNYFRKAFKFVGVPLMMRFKSDVNPYSSN
jgi:GTPase